MTADNVFKMYKPENFWKEGNKSAGDFYTQACKNFKRLFSCSLKGVSTTISGCDEMPDNLQTIYSTIIYQTAKFIENEGSNVKLGELSGWLKHALKDVAYGTDSIDYMFDGKISRNIDNGGAFDSNANLRIQYLSDFIKTIGILVNAHYTSEEIYSNIFGKQIQL